VGHLHGQNVHPSEEQGRFFHAMTQALSPDQSHGFHQGSGRIAQQDPIHRIVDVGFDASRIQEASLQIQRGAQAQLLRMDMGLVG
jgi:hypothetical protein